METPQEALAGLLAGQADIALVDRVSALQSVMSGQSVRIDPEPLVSDPYVIVLPRKAPILQREVGAALEALQADGTLDVLTNKWFGIPSP
jgi:ABC-type amino acid transport substrate-binding protein